MRGAPRTLLVAIALAIAVPAAASSLDSLVFGMPDSVRKDGACDSSMVWAEWDRLTAVVRQLRQGEYSWSTADSLTGLLPGQRVVWRFDLTGCRPCAFQAFVYDSTGNRDLCGGPIWNRWDGGEPVGVVGRQPAFQLGQVTPMPVRHRAVVEFQLAQQSEAVLELFDLSGRRVRTLTSGVQAAGHHLALFDASSLPAGLYLLRLQAGERQALRRVVVMR